VANQEVDSTRALGKSLRSEDVRTDAARLLRSTSAAWHIRIRSAIVCGMNSDESEMRAAVRELASALETMLNLVRADALPTTPEAHRLMREVMVFLDASTDRIAAPDGLGEILPLAGALNRLVISAREQILDDAVAASRMPDHPEM